MINTLSSVSNSALRWGTSAGADSPAEVTQYITFKLADYFLALPSQKILKIVATPPPQQGGLVDIGLVQLGQHSIQILDLSKLLGLKEPSKKTASQILPS